MLAASGREVEVPLALVRGRPAGQVLCRLGFVLLCAGGLEAGKGETWPLASHCLSSGTAPRLMWPSLRLENRPP